MRGVSRDSSVASMYRAESYEMRPAPVPELEAYSPVSPSGSVTGAVVRSVSPVDSDASSSYAGSTHTSTMSAPTSPMSKWRAGTVAPASPRSPRKDKRVRTEPMAEIDGHKRERKATSDEEDDVPTPLVDAYGRPLPEGHWKRRGSRMSSSGSLGNGPQHRSISRQGSASSIASGRSKSVSFLAEVEVHPHKAKSESTARCCSVQ